MNTEATREAANRLSLTFTALDKATRDLIRQMDDAKPANELLIRAVIARNVEMIAMASAACDVPYPYNPRLQPLQRAISDFTDAVMTENDTPIDDSNEDVLNAELQRREAVLAHLDDARVAGVSLMVHLDLAMRFLPAHETKE